VPLVGPLENGSLIVPALVGGKGPYLFVLDPDAQISSVDEEVVRDTGMRTGKGPHQLDENDTQQPAFYAEVMQWTLGSLVVAGPKPALVAKAGTYDRDGRRIHGVIGRDIIADSLVFGFDRDKGIITLETTKAFTPPPGAAALSYEPLTSKVENAESIPPPRRLVDARIGSKSFAMHVQLGRVANELRLADWGPAAIAPEKPLADVAVGAVRAQGVTFVPYRDRRWTEQDIDGALGLEFFKHDSLIANWDKETFYVLSRADQPLASRISRWQSKTLMSCEHVGCATVTMIDPMAGNPPTGPHPGLVVTVTRDASALQLPLEVLVAVSGKPNLSWLVASLPAGVDRAMTHVPADYLGATMTIADASPFPRTCPGDGGCIDKLAPP
jgi:hypothetical protein